MKSQTKEVVAFAALSVLLFSTLGANASASDDVPEGPGRVATPTVLTQDLQGINEQASPTGRQISALKLYEGRLYVGYGDFAANTGPIDLYSYDARSAEPRFEIQVPTEALNNFPEISGKLYAPYIDPETAPSKLNGFASNRDGSWQNYETIVDMIHNFDMETTNGTNLFVSGSMRDPSSGRNYAAIWYSEDGRTNWELIRKEASPNNTDQTQDRYYWMAAYDGTLYASPTFVDTSMPRTIDSWSDGSWTSTPLDADALAGVTQFSGADFAVIGDKLVLVRGDTSSNSSDRVTNSVYSLTENRRMDSSRTTTDVSNPWDPDNGQYFSRISSTGSTLYGMTGGGMVYSTKDAINWRYVMTVADVILPGQFEVDEAGKRIYIAMDKSLFGGIQVPHILTAEIPDPPVIPGNPGGNSGGFCIQASTEHAGKIFTGTAGSAGCIGSEED